MILYVLYVWERGNREPERIGMCSGDIICHSADTVVTTRQNRNDTVHAFPPHVLILSDWNFTNIKSRKL